MHITRTQYTYKIIICICIVKYILFSYLDECTSRMRRCRAAYDLGFVPTIPMTRITINRMKIFYNINNSVDILNIYTCSIHKLLPISYISIYTTDILT